ncbi:carbohydrate-binding domain-containing protein [Candidatus Saccharibacteria bacterium]|nr:carbohydrate-binding domain-containing protein [Candidatus Saccharibacteria bacterium]
MTDTKKNFWNGSEGGAPTGAQGAGLAVETGSAAGAGASTGMSASAGTDGIKKPFAFDWKWVASAVVLIGLMVGLAVAVNLNYNHTGDNASNISGTINIDNGDLKINWERYPSYNIELSETYTVTESGTYYFTGTLEDGSIIVKADAEAVVRIVLNGVTIKNSSGPAIACYSGDDIVIELVGENYLEDGSKYSTDLDEDVDGVIYSKSDLSFTGTGSLTIKGNYGDGIVSKDDLTFRSGTYNITAVDDAIRGKDSVHITDGDFTIKSTADAIKSTNETDTTKGFILIENGTFNITSSGKGIKATNSIMIYNGEYNIVSTDDAIHSNNYIGIIDGVINISSGDDGVHADARLIVDGGTINITKSYEGLEAQKISINAGKISIVANDDGINAGGGADASSTNRAGANTFDTDENCELIINDGEIYVNAAGDGVDSNGYLYFNGGTVTVDGPTNSGNGALDSGGGIVMNGGTVIAVGASGMAETLGSSSSVYNISVYFTSTLSAGTKIEIKNSAGETVISHTSAKAFNHLAAGTSAFKNGETYTIYVNGSEYQTFTISSVTTTVGSGGGMQNMMNGGQTNTQTNGQTTTNGAQRR